MEEEYHVIGSNVTRTYERNSGTHVSCAYLTLDDVNVDTVCGDVTIKPDIVMPYYTPDHIQIHSVETGVDVLFKYQYMKFPNIKVYEALHGGKIYKLEY